MTNGNREGYPSYWTEPKVQGGSLLLQPDLEQHSIVHSLRDVVVVLAERKLTSYVYAVGKQPTGNL
ncbi:hypothetical protein TIFTF001_016728 [Ficus carica]|uniref:Uncharacterized protein n=1 Tax=Ficus carica TaxID=3494 RepID=A0AA88D6F7_FICCA|nr:hypothetical protein TIFTF001_016728 [Ficus carica]